MRLFVFFRFHCFFLQRKMKIHRIFSFSCSPFSQLKFAMHQYFEICQQNGKILAVRASDVKGDFLFEFYNQFFIYRPKLWRKSSQLSLWSPKKGNASFPMDQVWFLNLPKCPKTRNNTGFEQVWSVLKPVSKTYQNLFTFRKTLKPTVKPQPLFHLTNWTAWSGRLRRLRPVQRRNKPFKAPGLLRRLRRRW